MVLVGVIPLTKEQNDKLPVKSVKSPLNQSQYPVVAAVFHQFHVSVLLHSLNFDANS